MAVNAQLWWLLAALIIGSVMGLFYYLRIILVMVDEDESPAETEIDTTRTELWVMGIVILLVIGIGVFSFNVSRVSTGGNWADLVSVTSDFCRYE